MRLGQFDLLDLPVYRLPEKRYYAERNAYVDQIMGQHPLATTPPSPSTADNLSGADARMRDHLFESYGGAWKYNEIIGYIRLHLLGSQVRAEYWRVNKKRIVRSRKKVFTFWHWKIAPETELPLEGSNDEIFQAVVSHVDACKAALPDRYVDATTLTTLGPYIDWHALLYGP